MESKGFSVKRVENGWVICSLLGVPEAIATDETILDVIERRIELACPMVVGRKAADAVGSE